MAGKADFLIRLLRREDRPAVREICAATAWLGSPDPQRVPDGWIWAEYWTRYFTDRQRRYSWLVEQRASGSAVGYLTGTADVRRFDRYLLYLLPWIVFRVVRKRLFRRQASRRALLGLLRSIAAGEMSLPPGVAAAYPATFHMNLLPDCRRCRIGMRLFEKFLAKMRSLRVAGVHAQTLSVNAAIGKFCERAGFLTIASKALNAFAHVDGKPIEIHTRVMPL